MSQDRVVATNLFETPHSLACAVAGVRSMQQGREAALAGVPLDEYAHTRPEPRAAIEKFGG